MFTQAGKTSEAGRISCTLRQKDAIVPHPGISRPQTAKKHVNWPKVQESAYAVRCEGLGGVPSKHVPPAPSRRMPCAHPEALGDLECLFTIRVLDSRGEGPESCLAFFFWRRVTSYLLTTSTRTSNVSTTPGPKSERAGGGAMMEHRQNTYSKMDVHLRLELPFYGVRCNIPMEHG